MRLIFSQICIKVSVLAAVGLAREVFQLPLSHLENYLNLVNLNLENLENFFDLIIWNSVKPRLLTEWHSVRVNLVC